MATTSAKPELDRRSAARARALDTPAARLILANPLPFVVMRVSRSSSDSRYRIDYISESCQAVWGLSRAQIGDNLRQLWTRIHPDDVSHLSDRLRAAERSNHEWTATFRIRGSVNGREKWAVARGLPRPDLPGDAWNITVTDITA